MIRIVDSGAEAAKAALRGRSSGRDSEVEQVVQKLIEEVRLEGDAALLRHARQFDAGGLERVVVGGEEVDSAKVSSAQLDAIRTALGRIRNFHEAQLEAFTVGLQNPKSNGSPTWQMPGERVGQRVSPLDSVGIYVPGGGAAYPSSVLMLAGPAKVAGVSSLVMTSPARPDGTVHPGVLVAMREVGVDRAFKIGGASAIAALALGTESVPRVSKIVGPGNRFVNEAKRQLWGTVGLDGYAGPSEVCVLVDQSANASFAAADLLTQIEHAPDNAGFLIAIGEAKLKEVLGEMTAQLRESPRQETMRQSLGGESLAFCARDLAEACEIVDMIAPEHLTLAVDNPEAALQRIHNAGCILMGEWTPESVADYCLGPSHTLPTGGAARFAGPVNVLDFLKIQSIAHLTRDELEPLIEVAEIFGELEGFPAHVRDATIRRSPFGALVSKRP